jgi:hypothetical protein
MVATAITAVGAIAGAAGSYQQAQAQKGQARYQAAVARNNAIIANQNAADARDRGEAAEDEHRRRIEQTKGSARAAQAGQGFLVDDTEDSTNVQMVADLAEAGELDVLRIRDNTEREARRAQIQGVNFQAEAGLFDLKASSISPGMAAGGSLLGSASSVYGTYKKNN